MKTVKQILVVALMLTLVTGYSVNIESKPLKDKTVLVFSNVKKGHELLVKTFNGEVVHRETIEKNGTYAKNFDLTALEDGLYLVELNKDFEIVLRPFKIVANKVSFLKDLEKSIFKPVVRTESNKVMISQLALNEKPLKVELYFNGDLIHKEELETKSIIEKVYQLAENQKGRYTLRMTSGDRLFVEYFTI